MDRGVLIDLARRVFVKNFYLKFIALVLSLALYIWVSEDRETVVAEHTAVQTVVPDGMVLVSDPVTRATVTLRGRWSDIDRFDPDDLDPIRLDLSPEDTESVISLTPDMVGVPPNLRVTSLEPNSVYVELERKDQKEVALNPRLVGEPAAAFTVTGTSIEPDTVSLIGPRSRLEEIDSIYTEPIDVSGHTESFEEAVEPRVDDGLLTAEYDERPIVEVDIDTEEITATLDGLSVEPVNTSYATSVEPASADVTVRGPKPTVDDLDLDLIRLEIDLSDVDDRPPGTYSRSPRLVNLPAGVEMVDTHPQQFRVVTESREPTVADTDDESERSEDDDSL